MTGKRLQVFEREGVVVCLLTAVFGNDDTGFITKQVKVDAFDLSFAFGNDKLSVCLVNSNEVYLDGIAVLVDG